MGQANEGLKPEVISDLTESTKLTEEEIHNWYYKFIKDCPNNYLTVDEFKRTYETLFPEGDSSRFAQHVFRTFDSNGDGKIDFREFICAMSVSMRGSVGDKLKWAFNTYDINKNGKISRAEMLEIVRSIYKMVGASMDFAEDENTPEKRVEKIFQNQDRDADDVLDLNEFVEGARNDPRIVSMLQVGR